MSSFALPKTVTLHGFQTKEKSRNFEERNQNTAVSEKIFEGNIARSNFAYFGLTTCIKTYLVLSTDSHGAGVTGSGGQQAKETGSGTTQQSQPFSYTALRQPEAVGIQTYGPYRRITPTLISKTTSSCKCFDLGRVRNRSAQSRSTTNNTRSDALHFQSRPFLSLLVVDKNSCCQEEKKVSA